MGLLDILKANGASDADIEAMKPLLGNEKFLSSIEKELSAKDEVEKARKEAEDKAKDFEVKFNESAEYAKQLNTWYNEQAVPAMNTLQKDALKAREEASRLQERIKAAKDYGLADIADPDPVPPAPVAAVEPPKVDLPDLSKYITSDTLYALAEKEGEAIALATDIATEHIELFGKRPNMSDLRKKAVDSKRTLKEVWESEYRVGDRRAEIEKLRLADEEKKKQDWIESIRKEEREKVISQMAIPTTRDPLPSKFPSFANKPADAKMPWETREGIRSNERVGKVLTTLAKSGVA